MEELGRIKALASEGKGVNEIARILGRSPATVSRCFKKLKLTGVAAMAKAGKLVQEKLDAAQQLRKINERINQILDDNSCRDPEKGLGDPDLVLKAAAEIRGQLKLQLEIFHMEKGTFMQKLLSISPTNFSRNVLSAWGKTGG